MPPLARELYPHSLGVCPLHLAATEHCAGRGCAERRAAFEQSSAALQAYWLSNERRLYLLDAADRIMADQLEARKEHASAA